ncbi:PilZ domain-containing protein [Mariprofundus erugo]|uniref:PilZ domain-containing protein n=1 Tax=Mariprofundus erugo TaxID=2528639 RepID=UPI0013756265|nr:PilZ domain-containing protein [Mariprofundus erugo]
MNIEKEERGFTRLKLPIDVTIFTEDQGKCHGTAHDISMSGVNVQLPECTLHMDSHVAVQLDFYGLLLSMNAKVARQINHEVALSFDNIELESYEHLARLIQLNSLEPEQIERELHDHIGLRERQPLRRHRDHPTPPATDE